MTSPARLLGFAFANADMLFEVDGKCTVTFATGAMSEFLPTKDTELVGRGAAKLFEPSDGVKFVTYAKAMRDGGRAGPLKLKLAGGKEASVSMCRLPLNGNAISCTLSHPGPRQGFGGAGTDAKTGLASRDGFLAAASAMASGNSAITLVDVPGLPDACAKLPEPQADRLMKRIGEMVQAAGTQGSGRLGPSTFGAVAPAGKPPRLGQAIGAALAEGGLAGTHVAETLIGLSGGDLSPEQRLLALRHVVGRFVEGTHEIKPGEDLVTAFDAMVEETQKRALGLTDLVLQGNFDLAFQPVVRLSDNGVAHHEALARFNGGDSTGETVAFAEALGISDAFDVAVAAKVVDVLEHDRQLNLALNLSGLTFCTPATFGLIAGLLATKRQLAPRLSIELTESAQIVDMAQANQAVQALRAMGYRVGLDDFGAGAASFQYLHAFEVDFVKFDAGLVRKLGQSKREDMLISGLVKLCRELGVATIAEGIEDAAVLNRVRAMGFDMGQGYHLGKPAAKAVSAPAATTAPPAKRRGERVSWG